MRKAWFRKMIRVAQETRPQVLETRKMEAVMKKLQEAKRLRDEKIKQEQIRRQKLFQLQIQRTQK